MNKILNTWKKCKSEPVGILELTNLTAANGEGKDQWVNCLPKISPLVNCRDTTGSQDSRVGIQGPEGNVDDAKQIQLHKTNYQMPGLKQISNLAFT